MSRYSLISLLAALLLLTSCGRLADSVLPKSGGMPYEVCVYATDTACAEIVDSLLSQSVAGMPQSEPQFDVKITKGQQPNGTMRYARAILIVDKDSSRYTATKVKYEKNVWAYPQIVVYINTPSVAVLTRSLRKSGGSITDLLNRFEMNAAISMMEKNAGGEVAKEIKRLSGYDIMLPAELRIIKKSRGFIRLSDNGAEKNENICFYSYPANDFDPMRATVVRDSVMAANLKGEHDYMYVTSTVGSTKYSTLTENGQKIMIGRGLWQMKGDAMGGPFVSLSILDTLEKRMTVAEALVYAPGRRKRNITRRLEAALYTMRKNTDK